MINSSLTQPNKLESNDYRYDFFNDGKVLFAKRKGRLPAMGWNSWNAFGSGNNEELTRITAEKFIELGLDKLGYEYLVLDDGCYKSERVDGRLSNEEQKFPGGFRALADFIHSKGLKFGMYNDIGTNLCAGAAVGTCGHEQEDAASYIEWDVDFLKVDNCYYLWDNATFSNGENAKYVYAPAIGRVEIVRGSSDDDAGDRQFRLEFVPGKSMYTTGDGVHTELIEDRLYFTNIGTFDGTGPARTPVGVQSGEVVIEAEVPEDGEYELVIDHINGVEPGRGSWLQIAVDDAYIFDDILDSDRIKLDLKSGIRKIRFMNHRRQENTLMSYAKLLEGLKEAAPGRDLVYSLCEWGKTQPQNWGRKLADSWRILNDITFSVGSDGNPGNANWTSDYTNAVVSQYNKAVIMDEFAGLDKGWNDPDMMVIGMNGLNPAQNRTHMAMWCMMNSPLMLGLDLRRITKGDELYSVIANKELIALNQDPLGIQAKRVYSSILDGDYDIEYVTNNDRVDILAKPLADGSVAISFINLSDSQKSEGYGIEAGKISEYLGAKLPAGSLFGRTSHYKVVDLWNGSITANFDGYFSVKTLGAFENVTIRVIPE